MRLRYYRLTYCCVGLFYTLITKRPRGRRARRGEKRNKLNHSHRVACGCDREMLFLMRTEHDEAGAAAEEENSC